MILRAAVCKHREFAIKTEISKFFISSQENPLVKHLIWNITFEVSEEFSFSKITGQK